jgi:hypothetical protein
MGTDSGFVVVAETSLYPIACNVEDELSVCHSEKNANATATTIAEERIIATAESAERSFGAIQGNDHAIRGCLGAGIIIPSRHP